MRVRRNNTCEAELTLCREMEIQKEAWKVLRLDVFIGEDRGFALGGAFGAFPNREPALNQ